MNIGYAVVPIGSTAPDTRLEIAAPWGPATAIVSALPFIKRRQPPPALYDTSKRRASLMSQE